MKSVRWTGRVVVTMAAVLLGGCASLGMGVSVPLGRAGGVGVSLGSDGQVGLGLGVGRGGVSIGVGGSTRLPQRAEPLPRSVNRGAPQWDEN